MAALTTIEKITIAKICEYLVANAIAKGGLYASGIDVNLPQKLYNIRTTIEYLYNQDPTDDTLVATSNYLYGLCLYNLQARNIMGNNAGIISGVIARNAPLPYQFTITSSSTPLANGESSVILTTFIGYNLIFNRNYTPQGTVDPGSSMSYYSWNKTTGAFVCYPAAVSTEFFQLFPI